MATTTPNFGWPVPTSTDLVKDGATAIEALGDSIDASLLDLKGGTTGQVLAKTSATDMDFTWTTAAAGGASVNLLLNSNFALNQRAYVSAANLSSGTYGFDRWKSNFTNTTLTFTASTQGQSLTINAGGGLQQIIEQGLVPAGTYTLSWTGTATGRVYNSGGTPPAYAASPVTFTADGSANVVVEYTAVSTTKTLSKVMFNAGTGTTWALATPTLQSELAACQRYYYRTTATQAYSDFGSGYNKYVSEGSFMIPFPVTMRITPTALEQTGTASNYNILHASGGSGARSVCSAVPSYQVATPMVGRVDFIVSSGLTSGNGAIAGSNNNTTAYLGWSAEL
jgi:hypothetical protein